MFESLKGVVTKIEESTIFLQTGPIEWVIEATASAIYRFEKGSEEVRVPVHLIHREDAMLLYGFASQKERIIFRELIKVSGIGPKQAIRILSGMEANQLIQAIENEDLGVLSSIPGVGNKSAGKIVLSLKGVLPASEIQENTDGKESNSETDSFKELVEALVGMGFDKKAVQKAMKDELGAMGLSQFEGESRIKKEPKFEGDLLRMVIVRLSS